MKVKRKDYCSERENWLRHCYHARKNPWDIFEAAIAKYDTSHVCEIEGIEGIWRQEDFNILTDEVPETKTSFKAGDTVFSKEGDPYLYDRSLGPLGHVVSRHLHDNVVGSTLTLTEVFATKPENKPVYKIFKYTLPIQERTHIDLPRGAQIVRVDGLEGGLWVWAMVDTTAPVERRQFALFKTGGDMPDNVAEEYKYVGCGAIYIQQQLMLYVFEKVSRE